MYLSTVKPHVHVHVIYGYDELGSMRYTMTWAPICDIYCIWQLLLLLDPLACPIDITTFCVGRYLLFICLVTIPINRIHELTLRSQISDC